MVGLCGLSIYNPLSASVLCSVANHRNKIRKELFYQNDIFPTKIS